MRKTIQLLAALATIAALVVALALPALATPKNCWGVVTSQMATSQGGMGEHASSFESPRLGLGNVARAFLFNHVSELGAFLASVDEIDETECGTGSG